MQDCVGVLGMLEGKGSQDFIQQSPTGTRISTPDERSDVFDQSVRGMLTQQLYVSRNLQLSACGILSWLSVQSRSEQGLEPKGDRGTV
jgi:hypothetical protein